MTQSGDDAGGGSDAGMDLGMASDGAPPQADMTQPPGPRLSIANATVSEGNSGTAYASFNVVLSATSADTVTVEYATADGTATTADNDYGALAGTLSFAPGETSRTISVPVNGDAKVEPTETFSVVLSNPVHAMISQGTGIGTIADDDNPLPVLTISDAVMDETNSSVRNINFVVQRSKSSNDTITVNYVTSDGTAVAGSDYVARSGTISIPWYEDQVSISVPVNGDIDVEPDETFTVTLSNPTNATIGVGTATGTIRNDDVVGPAVNVADAMVNEGNSGTTNMTFTVSLSASSAQTVTVDWSTSDFTARTNASQIGGADYTAGSGTLTFAPGVTTQTITVAVNGDATYENDEEFFLNLSNATHANIVDNRAYGIITNDDAAPTVSIADASVTEGDSGTTNMIFTVTQSAVSAVSSLVFYDTADGTAVSSSDYVDPGSSKYVQIVAGNLSATFVIAVNGDGVNEADETFTLNLTSARDATIADGSATATILNDDPLPIVSISDVVANEGSSGATTFTFTVTMAPTSSRQVTVNYSTADGTAMATDFDYTPASGTLVIAPGASKQTFTVQVGGDTTAESNETFTATLSSPTNATLGRTTATATIVNDD